MLGLELVALRNNPVDETWPAEDRPKESSKELQIHELQFAGVLHCNVAVVANSLISYCVSSRSLLAEQDL